MNKMIINTSGQEIKSFEQGFTIVRNAKVEVQAVQMHRQGKTLGVGARITVGDKFQHDFLPKSAVSQSLAAGTDALANRFNGGTFFFKDGIEEEPSELITYQDGFYKNFVHTDDGIQELLNHIGSTSNFNKSQHTNLVSKNIRLQNVRSDVSLTIPGMQSGGDMRSELSFAWSPFQSHVNAVFQIIRQICTNGMVGLADFMNTRIPLVNDWARHMQIVDAQIQNKMTNMIGTRMSAMSQTHASIRDCYRVKNACTERLNETANHYNQAETDRLKRIQLIVDPDIHLRGLVPNAVLEDQRLCDQTSSHLSEFTVWNMLTELASHTRASSGNSQAALHKHANAILIDRDGATGGNVSNRLQSKLAFQNVDAAFAHEMCSAM
jgi:hypothetical protein